MRFRTKLLDYEQIRKVHYMFKSTLTTLLGAAALVAASFTSANSADKPELKFVMAGSASGTFNSFNKVLVTDLEKFYDVTKVQLKEIRSSKEQTMFLCT